MGAGLRNEVTKLRHLRVTPLLLAVPLGSSAAALAVAASDPTFDPRHAASWDLLLLGAGGGIAMIAPLAIALMASRLVEIEHEGGGWMLSAGAGRGRGSLCRAKLLTLGLGIVAATLLAGVGILGTGAVLGVDAPPPWGRGAAFLLAVLLVQLALLALHLLLAIRVENQLIGIGVGLLGTMVAVFSGSLPVLAAHLTPWGHFTLARAAAYVDGELVGRMPSLLPITVLTVVMALLMTVVTRSLDRQES